ncbi:unnamed protein product, partial [Pylaiella littoralis]
GISALAESPWFRQANLTVATYCRGRRNASFFFYVCGEVAGIHHLHASQSGTIKVVSSCLSCLPFLPCLALEKNLFCYGKERGLGLSACLGVSMYAWYLSPRPRRRQGSTALDREQT